MKQLKRPFDELRFYWIFGMIVVTIMFFTIFFGNFKF